MLLVPRLSCWHLPEPCPSAPFHSKFVGTDNIEKDGLKKKNEEKGERKEGSHMRPASHKLGKVLLPGKLKFPCGVS